MNRRREWEALLRVAALLAIFLWAESSAAKDESLGPEPEAAITPEPSDPAGTNAKFDISLGGAAVTDYVSRGITQTDSRPAIQGYVEPSYGIAYVNIWSSNVDFGTDFRGAEIDVAGGIRPKFGPLSLDVGWLHYFYMPENVGPAYGEFFAKANYEVTDKFLIGTQIWFAPDFNQTGETNTFPVIGAKWLLPRNFSLYGGVGYQFFQDPKAFESLVWTVGVSYGWKSLTFDVRYWDTDLSDNACAAQSGFTDGCDKRVVANISVDLTWSEFRGQLRGMTE
jgi:uncharacterized protein (TIGR02001 family)